MEKIGQTMQSDAVSGGVDGVSSPFGDSRRASLSHFDGSMRFHNPSLYSSGARTPISRGSNDNRRRKDTKFKSYRLIGEYSQPWLSDKRFKTKPWNGIIISAFFILGVGLSAVWCFFVWKNTPKHDYCLTLEENFSGDSIDSAVWSHEVQIGGFGTGSFDWTTTDTHNSFVDSQGLHIVPTLTNLTTSITNDLIYEGYSLNLTADGTCTGTTNQSCAITSNHTLGTIIPPVRSARLSTKGKKHIKYGRVEVTAKLPRGDWLWPAIWMMPEDSVYGEWPRSGEIDIMESRGNDISFRDGGRNSIASTLHYGPESKVDGFWRSTSKLTVQRGDLSENFHTYGLEWSENYMYMYFDTRLISVLYLKFSKKHNLWDDAGFDKLVVNNTLLENPWANSPNPNAPFDQSFYLILNVAVGSQNGWFPDGIDNKPWVDASGQKSVWDFWQAADQWYPTWPSNNDRGLTVKSVKMWQQGKC